MKNLTIGLLALLVASGAVQPAVAETEAATSLLLPIRNARIPMQGVLSGGQPTREQIAAAAKAGFRTVINLRSEKEAGFEWEADSVAEYGMRYVLIPVPGADGLTRKNVKRVDAVLREAMESGPVLLHCGSGNRIGAILALREHWLAGIEPETALRYGVENGLTRLEPKTRELLGLDVPAPSEGETRTTR
jgi:uncharacterized protein (TIGR01244 family)